MTGTHLMDSSGLSVDDRLTAETLDGVITAAAGDAHPQLRPLLDLLPIAGGSGTLSNRYLDTDAGRAAAGWLRAKTGSLTGTNTLAGIVTDDSGRVLTFALMSNHAGPTGRVALDAVAEVLRSCGCAHMTPIGAGDASAGRSTGISRRPSAPGWPGPGRRPATTPGARSIDELCRTRRVRAELPVREVTGLNEGEAVTEARVVDRPHWVRAAAESMRAMTGAGEDGHGKPSMITGRITGAQTGAVLAFVCVRDSRPVRSVRSRTVAKLLLVLPEHDRRGTAAAGVASRLPALGVPARGDPPRAVPGEPVAGRLHVERHWRCITDEAGEDVGEVVGRLADFVRARRDPTATAGPNSEGIIGLLRAMQGEPQRRALDQLLVLGTLLEGHADHVMDAVGPAVVPSVADDPAPVRRAAPPQAAAAAAADPRAAGLRRQDSASTPAARHSSTTWCRGWAWSGSTPSGRDPKHCRCQPKIDKPQRWIDRVL